MINDRFIGGQWTWQWKRPITFDCIDAMLLLLQSELQHVTLTSNSDIWKWHIGSDGSFAVSTTRSHSDNLLLPSLNSSTIWNRCLPCKVNFFLWRFRLDRIPHRLNLCKHGIEIKSILCPVCNNNRVH
ncbi:reverse transcriptase zinc-binding domain-containing protein [Artemisia annua]|uniref:Reverse transcriptase zinc-binding domain-containing protein n=1 Tax=Artemisia annua TaxID=35608 RepID=A0A2U1PVT4_ARTAN|nr:reverse transcriptase zinc-binding domain-containing protein [Artemisia annua]